jgi:hypothetical protein|tara:strand:+ start:1354 stop:1605 length:252 start_codon:yes stop_codon:yes gene_type:complete
MDTLDRRGKINKKGVWTGPNYTGIFETAEELATRIEEYWHEKGYPNVLVWAEQEWFGKSKVFVIKSNLVNGLPPDAAAFSEAA